MLLIQRVYALNVDILVWESSMLLSQASFQLFDLGLAPRIDDSHIAWSLIIQPLSSECATTDTFY